MMKTFAFVFSVLLASPAIAQQSGVYNPLETRQQAYQRQQAEDYQYQQANPYSLNSRSMPLGESRITPSSRELNEWNGGRSNSLGSGSRFSSRFGDENE